MNCSVREEEDDLVDNLYYATHLEKQFVDFLVRLLLFSNVINKTFQNQFKKNLVLNTKRKIRIDVILEKHIDFLRGNLNANRQNEHNDIFYNSNPVNKKIDAGCSSLEKNWMH